MNAYAKINLFLDVPRRLPDGYHEIDTYMQSVSLHDTVSVERTESGIELKCTDPSVPSDEHNIAYKAADLFFNGSGVRGGCRISIEKNIPSQAGLGGGSADGACVLNALNILYGSPFSQEKLALLSSKVGADLPFCVLGGMRHCGGFGEKVGPPLKSSDAYFVISKGTDGISTSGAYGEIDRQYGNAVPVRSEDFIRTYEKDGMRGASGHLFNRFETVLPVLCPQCLEFIENIKAFAGSCMLSGSGSAVYSVAFSIEEAKKTLDYIKKEYPGAFVGIYTAKDRGFEITDGD